MPLTREQLLEIKSVIKEAVSALTCDEEFLSQIAKKVLDKTNLPGLEEKVNAIEKENTYLKHKLAAIEQQNLRNNLRISGINVKEAKQDILGEVVGVLNSNLGTILTADNFETCYLVGRQTDKQSIIVKTKDYTTKQLIIKARRKFKGTGIKVSEDMCRTLHKLFLIAIDELGSKNVWFANGTVFAKVDNVRHKIWSPADVDKLKK